MSDLWIYRRRSPCLTRYRHGGAAAFDPAVRAVLAGENVISGAGTVLRPAAREEDKILQFPAAKPAARKKRAGKPRGAPRAKPPKPKSGRKRD